MHVLSGQDQNVHWASVADMGVTGTWMYLDRKHMALLCSHLKQVDLDAAFGEDRQQKGPCSKTYFPICTMKVTILM